MTVKPPNVAGSVAAEDDDEEEEVEEGEEDEAEGEKTAARAFCALWVLLAPSATRLALPSSISFLRRARSFAALSFSWGAILLGMCFGTKGGVAEEEEGE